TRSSHQRNHLLLTSDTFVRTVLPGMVRAAAVVHISPALGAAFTQYTAEFEPAGELGSTAAQRFVYVLEGSVQLEVPGKQHTLGPRGFAYMPERLAHSVTATAASRVAVFEKRYRPLDSTTAPQLIVSSEDTVRSQALNDDSDLQVKCMLPDHPSYDFAV